MLHVGVFMINGRVTGAHYLVMARFRRTGCRKLTDMAVMELAGLPALRRLNLSKVYSVTDNGLAFLAEHCEGLERLQLVHCENVTEEGVRALLGGLPALELLNVAGVPALGGSAYVRLCDPADSVRK